MSDRIGVRYIQDPETQEWIRNEDPNITIESFIRHQELKFTGPNGEDLSIAALRGPAPPLRHDARPAPGVYGLRPTPIMKAVHKHLANLVDQSSSLRLTPDSALALSCIQSQRWRKVLEDEMREQGLELEPEKWPDERQSSSSLQLAALRQAAKLPAHLSLIHNLSSRLQQDTDKA